MDDTRQAVQNQDRLSHTAKPSRVTKVWRRIAPLVPKSVRTSLRTKSQYIHSRHLSDQDVLLLSYPKSGSTWLRSMLLMGITKKDVPASELANWVPPLHMASEPRLSKPRIVRSHDSLRTLGFDRASKKLVLVRDPRALVVSYFHHQRRRDRECTMMSIANDLLGEGFDNIGSWQRHATEALSAKHSPDCKILKYEDLLSEPVEHLTAVCEFYGLSISLGTIEKMVSESTPEKLRQKRLESGIDSQGQSGSDVRTAKAEGWRSECPKECQEMILTGLRDEMIALGYE